jgi:Tol biopolymer transport system component
MSAQPWAPDGRRLVFSRPQRSRIDFDLYTVDIDGSNLHQLTTERTDDLDAVWSPDGSTIAYTRYLYWSESSSLATVTPKGGTPRVIVEGSPKADYPLWSPDGNRILFERVSQDRGCCDYTINAVSANGRNEVEVTHTGYPEGLVTWSPDSQSVIVGNGTVLFRGDLTPDGVLTRKLPYPSSFDQLSGLLHPDWRPVPGARQ